MKVTFFLIGLFLFCLKAYGQPLEISFAEERPLIDGNANEWDFEIDLPNPKHVVKYRNTNHASWLWDQDYLYIAFEINDQFLCVTQSGNDNPYLYLNDAVEFYIDSHNDSKNKMDINDYQFIVSLKGESIIFKGDKESIKEGNQVPKEFGTANIVFKAKTSYTGTVNKMDDFDEGYIIEIALPWSAIGIVPKADLFFKMDLGVDDIDTVDNIRKWPDEFSPPSISFINLVGKGDFGFPNDWKTVKLIGGPSGFYQFKQFLNRYLTIVIIGGALLLGLMAFLIAMQYKKILFLKHLPSRSELIAAQSISNNDNSNTFLSFQKTLDSIGHEIILKAKVYIETNIETDFSIDQLSNSLHMSTRQLQRIFKEEAEITPKQFITIIRLEKASELLINSNNNVSEVAFSCGFSDPAYFTQVFKRYFGVAPSNYKGLHA